MYKNYKMMHCIRCSLKNMKQDFGKKSIYLEKKNVISGEKKSCCDIYSCSKLFAKTCQIKRKFHFHKDSMLALAIHAGKM